MIFYRCIPFRHRDLAENEDANAREIVEVLMINSTSGPGLLFPKVVSCESLLLKFYFEENL